MNPAFKPREVILDCADSRALLKEDYTIEAALTDARFYRAHPEVQIDPRHAKRMLETLITAPKVHLGGQPAKRLIETLLGEIERK